MRCSEYRVYLPCRSRSVGPFVPSAREIKCMYIAFAIVNISGRYELLRSSMASAVANDFRYR